MAMWQIPWWEDPECSWQVKVMLIALGVTKGTWQEWTLTLG